MQKLKKIAILGFPNVGKSTLFNRLLKEKKSLVHSLPGMTRDQVSAVASLKGKKCILIDTGGFFDVQEDPLSSQIRKKAQDAAEKADILVFVLDGKRDLLPGEEELFRSLNKLNKPMCVVINKLDSPSQETQISDFFRLGKQEIFPISAEHKRNIEVLEEALLEFLPSLKPDEKDGQPLKIALVGRINVGKSSIVNRLCGEERLIVSEIPGTTRDSTDTLIRREKKAFCLVDTAGIRKLSRTRDKREKASVIKAKKDITRADVICLIMDGQEFPTRQDSAIAHLSHESGKPMIMALNKWDLVRKDARTPEDFKKKCYAKLDFVNYAPLLFISALSGKKVIKILDLAEEVYANGKKRVGTSQLNSFLSWINTHHPPRSRKKQRVKIKYMTQTRVLPPTFILFSHSKVSLAPAYEKFFKQLVREKFALWGTPIRLMMRKS